jgi:hypothetical protein
LARRAGRRHDDYTAHVLNVRPKQNPRAFAVGRIHHCADVRIFAGDTSAANRGKDGFRCKAAVYEIRLIGRNGSIVLKNSPVLASKQKS